MKILITGTTGMVGQALAKKLQAGGHELFGLSRRAVKIPSLSEVMMIQWADTKTPPPPKVLQDIEVVVNLMGESINHRWTEEHKKKIFSSRVDATKNLAMSLPSNLKLFLSASAIGIYPKNKQENIAEDSAIDHDFLANVCQKWEEAAAQVSSTRNLIYRLGVVLSPTGGMLKQLLPVYRCGLGGPIGKGTAMMSWIHIEDLVDAIEFGINNPNLQGIFNLVSPTPVSSGDFARELSGQLHRPCLMRVPEFILKTILGEMATIAIDGQMISSKKLQSAGYTFKYPTINKALEEILR